MIATNSAPTGLQIPRQALGMSFEGLRALLSSMGQADYRATQIYKWIYARAASSFAEMSDLPQGLRKQLEETVRIERTPHSRVDTSEDGTKKYLFASGPGRFIEAAFIPESDRATLCLSTQVGCKMGCLFCATARQGFQAHLDAGQIVNQYLSLPEREQITNIVYMGMGEPFDNPQGTFASLELFTDPKGMALSPRRITVSTIGIIPQMERFLDESECNLAISIHSPFDEERRSFMPVQHVYPIEEVVRVLKTHSLSPQRKLSFEYILFEGVNDSEDHARALVRLLNGLRCKVNLIHYHKIPGASLSGSSDQAMLAFQAVLKDKGLMCTIRKSRGLDIQAACGLLSTKELVQIRRTDY